MPGVARGIKPLTFLGVTRRNLLRHPVRTVLTALGVSTGVIAVVALASISEGFWAMTRDALTIGGADLMIFQANQSADIFSTLDEAETRAALLKLDIVDDIAGSLWTVQRVNDHPFMFLMGARSDEFLFETITMHEGVRPRSDDELMVGRIAARTLKVGIGDAITVANRSMRVAGIFAGRMVVFDGGILMGLEQAQRIASRKGQITAAHIRVRDGVEPATAVEIIEREIPDLVAISTAEEYSKVDRGLMVMRKMVWAVSLIAVLVGGLVVLNTMWMSVFERTREIGILRALGWSRGRIVRMVIIESVFVCLLAAVVGSLLGVGLAEFASAVRYTDQFVSPAYPAWIFGQAVMISLVIGTLGGIIPSWRAARFSPIEALRYE